jgi:hypothetical protein
VPSDFFAHVPVAVAVERKAVPLVLKALKQGDGAKAAAEYQKMMGKLADEVVKIMRSRGLFDVVEVESGTQ